MARLMPLVIASATIWTSQCAITEVKVGGLFPMFRTKTSGYKLDTSGMQREAAALLAIKQINADTKILPNTKILFALQDSKRDAGSAFFQAFELGKNAFNATGVNALIGAASSTPSMNAALVGKALKLPQISYSSTSALLSDSNQYPYFFRTPPSDAFQGKGIVWMAKNHFKWNNMAVVKSTDGYGSAGGAAAITAARNMKMTIVSSQNIQNDAKDFKQQIVELTKGGGRVTLLFSQWTEAGGFMKQAYDAKFGGPGFTWFVCDAISSSWAGVIASLGGKEDLILNGAVGLIANYGLGSPKYTQFAKDFAAQTPTGSQVTGKGTKTTPTPGCSAAKDDNTPTSRYLWQQDHDDNAGTAMACAGVDFKSFNAEDISSYAAYAYDAAYALGYAFHDLIETQKKTSISGDELKAALLKVSFTGVTGKVAFNPGEGTSKANEGDRGSGTNYFVKNYNGKTKVYSIIGTWEDGGRRAGGFTPCTKGSSGCADLVYNALPGASTSVPPPDTLTCPSGYSKIYKDGYKCTEDKKMAVDKGQIIGLFLGLAAAWLLLTVPQMLLLKRVDTNQKGSLSTVSDVFDLLAEVMFESSLDAMELAAAGLIIVNFEDTLTDLQKAQIVLVSLAVCSILLLDGYSIKSILPANPDLKALSHFRHWHSVFTILIIAPVMGIEVQLYIDDSAMTDLICIIVLSIDLGFRVKGALEHLLHIYIRQPSAAAPAANKTATDVELATSKDDTLAIDKVDVPTSQPTVGAADAASFGGCCAARN